MFNSFDTTAHYHVKRKYHDIKTGMSLLFPRDTQIENEWRKIMTSSMKMFRHLVFRTHGGESWRAFGCWVPPDDISAFGTVETKSNTSKPKKNKNKKTNQIKWEWIFWSEIPSIPMNIGLLHQIWWC